MGNLKTIRENRTRAHEIGIHEISRRSGVSVTHVSKIFGTGDRTPSFRLAKKLAKAMGLSLDELFEEVQKAHRLAGKRGPGPKDDKVEAA